MEITKGLKSIKEGVENVPQRIKFPGYDKETDGDSRYLGEIANKYLNKPDSDSTYGLYERDRVYYHVNKGPQGKATYQKSKLYPVQFQKRRILKFVTAPIDDATCQI